MQKETIEVEWHKEAADQSSENCKLQKNIEKKRREIKKKTITKCKLQTLDY